MKKQLLHVIGQKFLGSLHILKIILFSCNLAAITIYLLVRLLFHDYNIHTGEEIANVSKTLLIGSALGGALFTLYFLVEMADTLFAGKSIFDLSGKTLVAVFAVAILTTLASCNGYVAVGVKKDLTTGLVAKYNNLEPENVMLVMNDEVLNHTDIPLGESFILINDRVKGLKEKNGKVSVGCSLTITDKDGKELLNEPDLLKGDAGTFSKDITYLKCTVSTGAPMQWEETYAVNVTFWDKNGNGKIENKVNIKAIDMP